MDQTSLEIFLTVAAERSVTRAAALLGRVPSNITTRIQQLEEDLGVGLFSRETRPMTVTAEGEAFAVYARRIVSLCGEARHAMKSASNIPTLRVGTMESTTASRLPEVLRRYRLEWPAARLTLTMGATRDLIDQVIAGDLDCALVAEPPDADASAGTPILSQLHFDRVFVEDLLVVLPQGHRAIASAADLNVDSLAALEPGCTYRRIAEQWGRRGPSLRTVELGSYHAILASVATGNAIGVMPRSVFELLQPTFGVQVFSLGPVDTLLVRRKNGASAAIDAFHDALSPPGHGEQLRAIRTAGEYHAD